MPQLHTSCGLRRERQAGRMDSWTWQGRVTCPQPGPRQHPPTLSPSQSGAGLLPEAAFGMFTFTPVPLRGQRGRDWGGRWEEELPSDFKVRGLLRGGTLIGSSWDHLPKKNLPSSSWLRVFFGGPQFETLPWPVQTKIHPHSSHPPPWALLSPQKVMPT